MIPLTRSRSAADVPANFRTPKREKLELELLERQRAILAGGETEHEFNSDRWAQAKEILKRDAHDKCAYCEAPVSVVAFGDVEHFRPKSVYWWLAYCLDNFLASCQLCNQKFKGAKLKTKHPRLKPPVNVRKNSTDDHLRKNAGRLGPDPQDLAQVKAFAEAHVRERPFLLNPYFDDPAQFYAWEADDVLRTVKLVPVAGLGDAAEFQLAAENDLGINRIELQEHRYNTLELFRTLVAVLREPVLSEATRGLVRAEIEKMQHERAPFAGMVRFFASGR